MGLVGERIDAETCDGFDDRRKLMSKPATMSGPISSSLPGRSDWFVMVGGMGSLAYQLLVNHIYSWVDASYQHCLDRDWCGLWVGTGPLSPLSFCDLSRGVCGTDADGCGPTQPEDQGQG